MSNTNRSEKMVIDDDLINARGLFSRQQIVEVIDEIDLRDPSELAIEVETARLNKLNEMALRTDTTALNGLVHTLYYSQVGAAHIV